MSDDYTPPKVWQWNKQNGGRFAAINRPIAGPTHDKDLPVGKHPLQLYSLATPNGVKVTVMLEELLAAGHAGAEYDAWLIRINEGEQFGSGFVAVNPNSKIPALSDHSGDVPVRVFESGSILVYLAEKFGAFLPTEQPARAECLSWLFWQMGAGPLLGGGFGHFYAYAPTKIEYAIDRYAMEVKRQLDVLDRRLAESEYLGGADYTIADMAVWPWYGALVKGVVYEAGEFLQVQDYTNVLRWTDAIAERPAVKRGRMVNRVMGEPASQLHERHDAADFDTRTQDKLMRRRDPADAVRQPPRSNPRRVRWFMAEKAIADVAIVEVDIFAGEHKTADYLGRAGLPNVPALDLGDGTTITESVAICRYLESVYPAPNMFGRDAKEAAVIEMWTRRAEMMLSTPLMMAVRHAHPALSSLERQVPEIAQRNREGAERALAFFDRRLGDSAFIAADRVTMADIIAYTGLDFSRMVKFVPAGELTHVARWADAMRARPAAAAGV